MKAFSETETLGVRVDNLNLAEAVEKVEDLIRAGGFSLAVTMNPEILMKARADKEFLEIVNKKTLIVTADGIGIILAGRLLGKPFQERITGHDLIESLAQLCLANNWPLMLMGGGPRVAQKALKNLKNKYPHLLGSATSQPHRSLFPKCEPSSGGQSIKPKIKPPLQLIKQLKEQKPAIVFVAMDFGKREKFILQLIEVLKKKDFGRGMVFVGVGGALDYLAGTAKRAPRFFQQVGLEWLWRLVTQPRTRFTRQLKSLPPFAFLVLKEALCQKVR